MILEKHILITNPESSVTKTLKNELELSTIQIKQAIQKGCLWLENGNKIKRLRRLKTQLKVDQELHFYYNDQILGQRPLVAELIEDNQSYSIWHKPAGMLCQGSKWGDHTTIYRFVEQQLQPQRQAIIVHRLDKMTSGLLILAHHKKIAAAFSHIFERREIKKSYRVLVHGQFTAVNNKLTIDKPIQDKAAISHIQLIAINPQGTQSLLDVCIETGRKHQIRSHLASVGFPVVGDRLYGIESTTQSNIPDLQLTACELQFLCPVNGEQKHYRLDKKQLPQFL